LAELREWQALADSEARPDVPPAFRINHHFDEDARDLYFQFLQLNATVHAVLAREVTAAPTQDTRQLCRELVELENRVRRLGERFINR
jgi:hypothetical protein